MLYTEVPIDVMKQLDTFRQLGLGMPPGVDILGVVPQCLWVFGTAKAKSLRPFDKAAMSLIESAGVKELMVLADPEEYIVYGLALETTKDEADHIMSLVNENGAGFCMIGIEVEGWQVYEA